MKDELAEEMTSYKELTEKILKKYWAYLDKDYTIEAMQEYYEAKLKEELIDFLYWYDGTLEYTSMNSLKEVVDKYLNQKP